MEKVNIFSPFFYHFKMEEHPIIKDAYLDDIISNYNLAPFNSHDWNVHTDYKLKDGLKQLDWWTSIQHYKKYVNQFIEHYFRGLQLDWRIDDNPWYTAYGKGQKADQHDHMTTNQNKIFISI